MPLCTFNLSMIYGTFLHRLTSLQRLLFDKSVSLEYCKKDMEPITLTTYTKEYKL